MGCVGEDAWRRLQHNRTVDQFPDEANGFGRNTFGVEGASRTSFEAIDQAFRSRIQACLNAVLEAPPREAADPTMVVNEG